MASHITQHICSLIIMIHVDSWNKSDICLVMQKTVSTHRASTSGVQPRQQETRMRCFMTAPSVGMFHFLEFVLYCLPKVPLPIEVNCEYSIIQVPVSCPWAEMVPGRLLKSNPSIKKQCHLGHGITLFIVTPVESEWCQPRCDRWVHIGPNLQQISIICFRHWRRPSIRMKALHG